MSDRNSCGLRVGDKVWWNGSKGTTIGTIVEVNDEYFRVEIPQGLIRGQDVHPGFTLAIRWDEHLTEAIHVGEPAESPELLPIGELITVGKDTRVHGFNVLSPRGNRCRSVKTLKAGQQVKLVELFRATGWATHGSVCARLEDDKGYQYGIFVERLLEWLGRR